MIVTIILFILFYIPCAVLGSLPLYFDWKRKTHIVQGTIGEFVNYSIEKGNTFYQCIAVVFLIPYINVICALVMLCVIVILLFFKWIFKYIKDIKIVK